jgi:hypothetical protein
VPIRAWELNGASGFLTRVFFLDSGSDQQMQSQIRGMPYRLSLIGE